jgi:hypothetical protein
MRRWSKSLKLKNIFKNRLKYKVEKANPKEFPDYDKSKRKCNLQLFHRLLKFQARRVSWKFNSATIILSFYKPSIWCIKRWGFTLKLPWWFTSKAEIFYLFEGKEDIKKKVWEECSKFALFVNFARGYTFEITSIKISQRCKKNYWKKFENKFI